MSACTAIASGTLSKSGLFEKERHHYGIDCIRYIMLALGHTVRVGGCQEFYC